MSHRCLEPMELAALYGLPVDDPRRLEAADCPRCDSLLRAMTAFGDGNPALPAGERRNAETQIAKVLAAAVSGAPSPAPGAAAMQWPGGQARPESRSARRPTWTWGLGLAAVVAGLMIVAIREPSLTSGPSGVLRGGASDGRGLTSLAVEATRVPGQDRISLTWPEVPGAESYRLELFTSTLDTLAIFDSLPRPVVVVEASLLADAEQIDGTRDGILYRVRALGNAGQVAVSPLTGIVRPR